MKGLTIENIQDLILDIRNKKVLLDSDKFPNGYVLNLSDKEWGNLKTKISSSSWGGKRKLPSVFTEKGLYMLATILKRKNDKKNL